MSADALPVIKLKMPARTSGNSKNVLSATVVARALDIPVIGLTDASGGELAKVSTVCIRVSETETYKIQELHLPVYHCLCLMLEDRFFGKNLTL